MPRFAGRLLWALSFSLLLHLLIGFGDSAWQWWLAEHIEDEGPAKATSLALKAQALDEQHSADQLPDGTLSVQLGRPSPRRHHAAPTAAQLGAAAQSPLAEDAQGDEAAALAQLLDNQASSEAAPAPAATEPSSETAPARPEVDTRFPRSVDIDYVAFGIVEAEHRWRAKGKRYEISTRIKLEERELRSVGEIGRYGLRPALFSDKRDSRPQPTSQAQFDWGSKTVRLGEPGKQIELALEEGAQDMFSAAYQFALQGDQLPSFTMQVLSGRHSYQVPFEIKGETELKLSNQSVTALVLAGSHKQRRFEFYLAPGWHNLPVRIRMSDGDRVIDLRALQIRIDGELVLAQPQRLQRDR